MPDQTPILSGDCFYSPSHGLAHYYQQKDTFVLHVNTDSQLINRLDVSFIATSMEDGRMMVPIIEDEFSKLVRETLDKLDLV